MTLQAQNPGQESSPRDDRWRDWLRPPAIAFAIIAVAEGLPPLRPLRPYVAPLVLLYLPFLSDSRLTLAAVGLRTPTRRGVLLALTTTAALFPAFYAVTRYWLWGAWPGPPQPWIERLFAEILFAALPEEVFFRGWLQPRADRLTGGREWRCAGVRCTAGNVITSAAFAVMHLSTGRIDRLNVFVPGLWFGWLAQESRSIWPAVVVHAVANVWMAAATGY